MAAPDVDRACMTSLEFVERGGEDCNDLLLDALRVQGLVVRFEDGWALTPQGELRLRNLRSVLQTHAR